MPLGESLSLRSEQVPSQPGCCIEKPCLEEQRGRGTIMGTMLSKLREFKAPLRNNPNHRMTKSSKREQQPGKGPPLDLKHNYQDLEFFFVFSP